MQLILNFLLHRFKCNRIALSFEKNLKILQSGLELSYFLWIIGIARSKLPLLSCSLDMGRNFSKKKGTDINYQSLFAHQYNEH